MGQCPFPGCEGVEHIAHVGFVASSGLDGLAQFFGG